MSVLAFDPREVPRAARLPVVLGGVAVLLGAVAVLRPPLAIALAAGAIFVGLAFVDLAAGVAFFVTISFFERIPGVPASSISTKLAGGVLAAGWLVYALSRDRQRAILFRDRPWLAYSAVAFWGWTAVSIAWATDSSATISNSLRLIQGIIFLFIVYTAVTQARHVRWVLAGFLAGAALTALIGLAGATQPESFSPYADPNRLSGQIGDPNEFAAALIPALAFAVFGISATRKPMVRWALWSLTLLFTVAIFLTNSRGGLVGLAVMLLAGLVLGGRLRARVLAAIVLIVTLATAYYSFVASPQALQRITQFTQGGGTGRLDIWSVAGTMWRDHPIVGVGYGNFTVLEPTYASRTLNLPQIGNIVDLQLVVHNLYLHLLVELGVVGLALFVLLAGGALYTGVRSIGLFVRAGDRDTELLARAVVIGTLGLFASYMFLSAQSEKQLWLMLGLLTALASVAQRAAAPAALAEPAAEPLYDLDVREQLVEQLERRVTERMDALLAESERLSRRRAALAVEEERIRTRARELDELGRPAAPAAAAGPERRELEALQVQVVQLRRERDEAKSAALEHREKSTAEVEALRGQLQQLRAERDEARGAAERGHEVEELESLRGQVDQLRVERDEARNTARSLLADRVKERRAEAELRERVAELEREREEARGENARLREQLESVAGRIAELEEAVTAAQTATAERASEQQGRLDDRVRAVAERERALVSRAATLAQRERALDAAAAETPSPSREPVAAPAPAAPEPALAPEPEPAPDTEAGAFELSRVERLVEERGAEFPDRIDEWQSYLFFLRDHADAAGRLPRSFDSLVDEVFGDLL